MINWTSLFIYSAVLCFTPGPNNINCLYFAAKDGFKKTIRYMIGSMGTLFVKILLCGCLNVLLATIIPAVTVYLKWAGALYMLYIAWHMAKSGWEDDKEETTSFEPGIKTGIMLQLLNGKSWVAAMSLYSVYVIPHSTAFLHIFLAAFIFSALAGVASVLWAGMGIAIKNLMSKHKKIFGIVMSLGLVYCAVSAVL